MDSIDLSGQVAVVTGAGSGLGRGYALDLAGRGAHVLVNDIAAPQAEAVADEIRAHGGAARACVASVATSEGAAAIAAAARAAFGAPSILINNAGFLRNDYLQDMSARDFDDVLAVHARGAFLVTQALWPGMREAGYGRVVMTGSAGGMFAMPGACNYVAAKGAVYALGRALAQEGALHGIAVNTVLPRAATGINAKRPIPDYAKHAAYPPGLMDALAERRTAESVVPLVTYLASRECRLNGETLSAAFGRYSRVFVGQTAGWYAPDPGRVRAEDVASQLDRIMRVERFSIPRSLFDEVREIAAALGIPAVQAPGGFAAESLTPQPTATW